MSKLRSLNYKYFCNKILTSFIFLSFLFLLLTFYAHAQAQSSTSFSYQCTRWGGTKTCNSDGTKYLGPGYAIYSLDYQLYGHRHGSSRVSYTICMRPNGGETTGKCDSWMGTGSDLGFEYGGNEPTHKDSTFDSGNFPGNDSSGYFIFYWIDVMDATATLWGNGSTVPFPPPNVGLECINNTCTEVLGSNKLECSPPGDPCVPEPPPIPGLECINNTCTEVPNSSERNCSPKGSLCNPLPGLRCSPTNQTVGVNQNATFFATGGDGTYSWVANDGTPGSGIGSSFSTSYPNPDTGKTIRLTDSSGGSAECSVVIVAGYVPPSGGGNTTCDRDASTALPPCPEVCGDGRVGAGEECDLGSANGPQADCSNFCRFNSFGSCELPSNPYFSTSLLDLERHARRLENNSRSCYVGKTGNLVWSDNNSSVSCISDTPTNTRLGQWRVRGEQRLTTGAAVCSTDNSCPGCLFGYSGITEDDGAPLKYDDRNCHRRYSCTIDNPVPPPGPPGLICNINNGSVAVGGYEFSGQAATKAFDGNEGSFYSGYYSDGARGNVYIGRSYSSGISVRRIKAYGTASFTFNGPIQYSDDNNTWINTGFNFAVPAGNQVVNTIDLPDLGKHSYWRVFDSDRFSGGDVYHQISELEFYDCALKPTVDIKANNSDGPTVTSGSTVNLSWTSTDTDSCSASQDWTGSKATAGNQSIGPLTSDKIYTITCSGPGGSAADGVIVTVDPPPSIVVDIKCNGSDSCTIPFNGSVNLTWTSSGLFPGDTCTASGDWSGSQPQNGGPTTFNNITVNKSYTITCNRPLVGDSNFDTVNITVDIPPPVISDPPGPGGGVTVSVNNSNFCSAGPHATIDWTYSDPLGLNQIAYQISIDDDGIPDNGGEEYESGVVGSTILNGGTGSVLVSGCNTNNPTTDPQRLCRMTWNQTYQAWIKVENAAGRWSGWTLMSQYCNTGVCNPRTNWTTPVHAFPAPFFTFSPSNPATSSPVTFTDGTTFAASSINKTWSWNFGGGVPGSATGQGPHTVTYFIAVPSTVSLTASDDVGSCTTSIPLSIQRGIPQWREVLPK